MSKAFAFKKCYLNEKLLYEFRQEIQFYLMTIFCYLQDEKMIDQLLRIDFFTVVIWIFFLFTVIPRLMTTAL